MRTKTRGLDRAPTGDLHSVKAIDLESFNKFFELFSSRLHCLSTYCRTVSLFCPLSLAIHRAHYDDRIASSAPARERYKRRESFCVYRQV
jgi:hypothetical protein